MNLVRMDDIKNLISPHEAPCVSIYMPTHRSGKDTEQDPIRFKNLLRRAEDELVSTGLRQPDAAAFLDRVRPLLEDSSFWRHQSDGLAVFICRDDHRHYRVPFEFPEMAVVNERFYIKPLVPLITNDGRFYVLAFSKGQVRVLQGTRDSIAELDLEGLPEGIADALRFDLPQKQLQFHTEAPSRGGRRDVMYFGSGDADPDMKNAIKQYFQQVDKGLQPLLREERAPLVLAGVDYLHPIYKEANSYKHLVEEGISGNPDHLSAQELHDKAWRIVQPQFQAEQDRVAARFEELMGQESKHASDSFLDVVPAAYHGRVEALFVPLRVQQWGTFNPDTSEVVLHDEQQPGDQDLLDYAAMQTLATGGIVYGTAPENVPGESGLAAVFRY